MLAPRYVVVEWFVMRKSLLLALSLLGLWDSAYLWWAYTSPSRPMVCLGTGCDVVRASPLAYVWGHPLPAYGFGMYAVLSLLIFSEVLVSGRLGNGVRYAVAGISGAGFLISLYLTGVEAVVLHAWCAWCVVSALSVTLIFALAIPETFRPAPVREPAAALATVRKHFGVIVIALVVSGPAFLFLSRHGELPRPQPPSPKALLEHLVRPDSHTTGNPQAPLTVVEFGDFQCPVCGRVESVVQEIRQKYGTQIRFVFRQYPIAQLHAHAEKAAEASECAAEQGRFWEAEEKLYENQTDLSESAIKRYAAELGLDQDRFNQCLASGKMAARVRRDVDDARALGITGTPTFFIGRRMVVGPLEMPQFSQLVEQELADRGVTSAELRASPRPQPEARPATPSRTSAAPKQPRDPRPAPSGLLANNPSEVFSQFQTSGMACSEEEAAKQQPTLIRTAEARQLFEEKSKASFVDVRTAKDFSGGRISGAINVPVDEIEQRWSQLPRDRRIILYESGLSAGDLCASSRAAGRVLLAHGFARDQVKVYQDGLAGWQKAGLPIEH